MLSIVIPFHNEKENLRFLYDEIVSVMEETKKPFEIIYVDDGSTDEGSEVIRLMMEMDKRVRLVRERKKRGKGEALASGIMFSEGSLILFMDADLQDDPHDIPHFLEKISQGYDLVNGVRSSRKDNGIIKLYSSMGNTFIKNFLKSPFTDINCGFKLMKREIVDEITLYGNNFRFLPLAAYYGGFKVGEIPVHHRPRKFGKSKFGLKKPFIGFLDTMTAYFIYRFSERPLHFFGIVGTLALIPGGIILLYLGIERLIFQHEIYRRPILFLGLLLVIVGFQIIMTGFIGELIVYMHKKKNK